MNQTKNQNRKEMEKNILSYGLDRADFRQTGCHRVSPELKRQRFVAFFGVCHKTCAAIFWQ